MRLLSQDLVRLRVEELPFVNLSVETQIKICDYLNTLDDETIYSLEKHTETPQGARKLLNFLLKKIGDT
ncbi:hypothetical protein KVP40.0275 [Vibrio phage KVP40]|uniref:Uncharacterized protein n=4 Tax=Schizotequatrovirus KVP40 TaxID=1914019 RepID=Q6WHM9_BPKVM|nr:hypothetical protein KVP40.0275 [Vibrio phage KVP40]AFN37504.1 hypothetical protein pp2_271 [Vibrio phage phi-pp2]QHJ74453.1 hypothetical protein VH12019_00126 [Vibrio phage VH1_2019]QIW90152.1 hypothetical protein OLCHANIL_00055 [Vibrio phage V05]QIW91140.1 hypothetical protein COHAPHLL_00304 [Vibrio phage V09]UNA01787.1 hypothetical protein [Vibrio phage PC-Liy1]URQ03083.1 hypothetical protein PVA8_97 [Vibrio phage PVA8]WBM58819.1 hypothetical protein vBValMPVA8_97 [Vibrio phage vB_ValM